MRAADNNSGPLNAIAQDGCVGRKLLRDVLHMYLHATCDIGHVVLGSEPYLVSVPS